MGCRITGTSVLTHGALSFLLLCAGISQAQTTLPVAALEARSAGGASAARVEYIPQKLPLSFEINKGQFDRRVKFLARGQGRNVFLTAKGMVVALGKSERVAPGSVVRLEFQDGNSTARFEGVDQLDTITNYFIGDESTPFSSKYFTNVSNFARVRQQEIYPGIDVVYYGSRQQLEYDLVVAPGADATRIKLDVSGHDKAGISKSGDLVLTTRAGEVMLKKPIAYQEARGERIAVPVSYVLDGNKVRFDLAAYDASRALVIDPILSYSTFLGGTFGDSAYGVAVDANGNAYIVGETSSTDFPVVNPFQAKRAGDSSDAFVSKLNASGTGLVYSTYLGGSRGNSNGTGIAVDAAGNAYVVGSTTSSAFPVTKGAYQTRLSTSAYFVSKFGPQGNTLIYSTFVNGVSCSFACFPSIAVDASGNAYVTGIGSPSFMPTAGAFQGTIKGSSDAIVVKLNSTGTGAVYATFLGGHSDEQGFAIAVDGSGNAYVTGYTTSTDFPVANAFQPILKGAQDAFVTKFGPTGALLYSTYLGGSASDTGESIAVDSVGHAYVAGSTASHDFPVLRAFQSIWPTVGPATPFVTKMDTSGSALVYSTFYGGPGCITSGPPCNGGRSESHVSGIALDGAGNVYLAGGTDVFASWPQVDPIVTNLPTIYDTSTMPFVAKIQELSAATLTFSTIFGTPPKQPGRTFAQAIAVDAHANIYVVGSADTDIGGSTNTLFPTTPGALKTSAGVDQDAFAFKITPGRFPTKLLSSNSNPTSAETITLTAIVTSTVPGGTVTLTDNGNFLGTAPVSLGGATFTTTFPAGVHQLTATYSGDNKASRSLFLPVRQATN